MVTGGYVFLLVTNIMISLVLAQFLQYHYLTYTCNYNVEAALLLLEKNVMMHFGYEPLENKLLNGNIALLDIIMEMITYVD